MQMQETTQSEPKVVDTGCCPRFEPAPWQDAELHWERKLFVKEHVPHLFHVPIGMGRRLTKQMELIQAAGAQSQREPMLSLETSAWGEDLHIPVTKPVPGAEMTELSGTFLTKVFEGPFRDTGKWIEQMIAYVAGKQQQLEKIYLGYTTCPKCAKAYGKNYVVLFAKVRAEHS